MKKRFAWLDWFLYFGTRDERHRSEADRAGHLAFWVVYFGAFVSFLLRLPAFKAQADLGQAVALVGGELFVLLVGGVVYGWLWIRAGLTIADTAKQRRWLRGISLATGLLVTVLFSVPWRGEPWELGRLLAAVLLGAIAWGVTTLTFRWQHAWARRRADRLVSRDGDAP